MAKKLAEKYYAAVRMSDGGEFLDQDTMSGFMPCVSDLVKVGNEACGPQWAKDNPVRRIVQIEIREL